MRMCGLQGDDKIALKDGKKKARVWKSWSDMYYLLILSLVGPSASTPGGLRRHQAAWRASQPSVRSLARDTYPLR